MSLLQRRAADIVNFVDVLKQPMKQLELKCQQSFPSPEFLWNVLCCDLKDIEIPNRKNQLFIIAGVGGDKTIEFIQSIHSKTEALEVDFLICSVHGNYRVREAMIELSFSLLDERIIKENKRFYELIYVSKSAQSEISKTGDLMWDWDNSEHLEYLAKTINHFDKKARVDPGQYQKLLDAYRKLA